jgi:hypothetical protein
MLQKKMRTSPSPSGAPIWIRHDRLIAHGMQRLEQRLLVPMSTDGRAMANELRTSPGLNFGAFQPARRKPGG